MNDEASIDPGFQILQELDPSNWFDAVDDFWNHPKYFNEEVHMLVLMGLDAMLVGIDSWEQDAIQELNRQADGQTGSERYGEKLEDIYAIASLQRDFAYNLFFTGLMDALARRFTKIAQQIDNMSAYLPPDADRKDPRLLVIELRKWSKDGEAKLDLTKLSTLETSGRLQAAREARNLLVHGRTPAGLGDSSSREQCVRSHFPGMIDERGSIQVNQEQIGQIATDAEALISGIVDKHRHGWLMLLHEKLSNLRLDREN